MNIITRLEEAILISIWRLKDNAYGVAMNKQVSKSSQKKYSLGALYFALDQLFRKGFVKKTLGRVYHEKGGAQPDILHPDGRREKGARRC